MYEDQKHIECVVREMLKSLCKVSIAFSQELHIQGTLGITVDRNGIFLVQINEILNLNSAVHSANLHSNDNDNLSVPFVKIEPDDPPNYQSHDISRNSKHISQIAAAYRSELSHTELTTPANEQFAPLEYNLHQIEKSNSEDSFGIERNDCYKDANNQKECGNLDNDKLNRRQQTCTNDSRYKTAKTEAAETVKVIPRLESGITELCEEKLLSPIHRVASDNPDRISLLPRPQILPGNLSTHKFLGRSEFIRDFNNKSNVKEEDECDEGDTRNHSNGRNIRNSSFMKDDFIYDMPYIPRKKRKAINRQSEDNDETDKHTKWAGNVFRRWCDITDTKSDMNNLNEEELQELLSVFYQYASVTYHKTTIPQLRVGIRRYFMNNFSRDVGMTTCSS